MEIIQQIGSYAGLAAVLGLAVLAALYFSQARDVKRLREWAGRAPERVTPPVQTSRVVARPVPTPTPPPAPPASPVPPRPVTPAAGGQSVPARAAAAGAAPAALSQDTMAHPPPGPPLAPPVLGGHFAREAEMARERELADETGDQHPEDQDPDDGLDDPELEDEELNAADDELEEDLGDDELRDDELPGEEQDDDGRLGEETGPRATGSGFTGGQPPSPRPSPPPLPSRPISPPPPVTASRQPLPPRPSPPRKPSAGPILPPYEKSRPGGVEFRDEPDNRRRTVLTAGGAALLLAIAAFGVLQLTGGGDAPSDSAKKPPSEAPEASTPISGSKPAAKPGIVPADVTVSVLNGTTVGGLAAQLGDRLEGQGFQLGNVTNNTDQQRAESVVLFAPGAESEAKDVGRRLKIDQREPVDPDSQSRAGDATVVVIAGADLNE